jgi:hypothetical protein
VGRSGPPSGVIVAIKPKVAEGVSWELFAPNVGVRCVMVVGSGSFFGAVASRIAPKQ